MTFESKIELAILVATGALTVSVAAVSYARAQREYKKTFAQIELDHELNSEAIRRTQERIRERIWDRSRPLPSVNDLVREFNEELEFQKIAVRNR